MAQELVVVEQGEAMHILRSWRDLPQRAVTSHEEAEKMLAVCDQMDQPAETDWIACRVATLLSHFYVSSMSESEQRMLATDWVCALEGLPRWAIEQACAEWLRTESKRPTIAAIRKAAEKRFEVVPWMRRKAMMGPTMTREARRTFPEPECAKRRREIAESVMRSAKFITADKSDVPQ